MLQKNKSIAQRFLDALWNTQNYAVVDELLASDYDGHSSTVIDGPEGAKQFVPILRSAFPDFKFTVVDQVAEGDRVATRWIIRGTHHGEFQGVPPTGRKVEISGITIFRVADGVLVDGWTNEDLLGLLQQLGAAPEPQSD
jgi:steroid delta-isomerase-like uncharacterized protein